MDQKIFILSGAIEVVTSAFGNKDYVAYCKTLGGYWVRKKKDSNKSKKNLT